MIIAVVLRRRRNTSSGENTKLLYKSYIYSGSHCSIVLIVHFSTVGPANSVIPS